MSSINKKEIINWLDPEELKSLKFVSVRESLSQKWAYMSPDEIATTVSYMTIQEHLAFCKEIFDGIGVNLKGVGAEVGAGAAVVSNSLASIFPNIKNIYAIDIVPKMVELLQPIITEYHSQNHKITPVIGSFDKIKITSELDFVIAFDALHHSNNIQHTLLQIFNALKPGGKLIIIDRANPDNMPDEQKDFLLSIQYSKSFKETHNIPADQSFTREENGEHEPKLSEWLNDFMKTGFALKSMTYFVKRDILSFMMQIAAQTPFKLRNIFKKARNFTGHKKTLLWFFFPIVGKIGLIKVKPLKTQFKTKSAPKGKLVFVLEKK